MPHSPSIRDLRSRIVSLWTDIEKRSPFRQRFGALVAFVTLSMPMSVDLFTIKDLLKERRWLQGLAMGLVQGDDADDVVQETMISALHAPPTKDRPLRPWLKTVAKNVVRMKRRSETRRKQRDQLFVEESPTADALQSDLMNRFAMHRTLVELLSELPSPFRETLLLRYFDDKTSTEIAEIESISAGTVRWRIKRGLELLRGQLDSQQGDRRGWVLALQPLLDSPAGMASSVGSATSAAAKGAIMMKTAKASALAVALVATSYSTYRLVDQERAHSETRQEEPQTSHAQADPRTDSPTGSVQSNRVSSLNPTAPETRRTRLSTALLNAKRKRLQREDGAVKAEAPVPVIEREQLSPQYVADRMKELMPLIRGCHSRALDFDPTLEGKATVSFTIVGEEDVGALLTDSFVDPEESTIHDETFTECISETMYALELDAPPSGGGEMSFRIPIVFRIHEIREE